MQEMCKKCTSVTWLTIGILILLNIFFLKWAWSIFVGTIFIIAGLIGILTPNKCSHCKKQTSKKRRKQ